MVDNLSKVGMVRKELMYLLLGRVLMLLDFNVFKFGIVFELCGITLILAGLVYLCARSEHFKNAKNLAVVLLIFIVFELLITLFYKGFEMPTIVLIQKYTLKLFVFFYIFDAYMKLAFEHEMFDFCDQLHKINFLFTITFLAGMVITIEFAFLFALQIIIMVISYLLSLLIFFRAYNEL